MTAELNPDPSSQFLTAGSIFNDPAEPLSPFPELGAVSVVSVPRKPSATPDPAGSILSDLSCLTCLTWHGIPVLSTHAQYPIPPSVTLSRSNAGAQRAKIEEFYREKIR